jgi:hypothetical protein
MRADGADVARSVRIVDRDDQAVLVALDVEYNSVLADDARVRVDALDVRRRVPVGPPRIVVPRSQGLLSLRVLLPELSKRSASDDPHRRQYTALPSWEQVLLLESVTDLAEADNCVTHNVSPILR